MVRKADIPRYPEIFPLVNYVYSVQHIDMEMFYIFFCLKLCIGLALRFFVNCFYIQKCA